MARLLHEQWFTDQLEAYSSAKEDWDLHLYFKNSYESANPEQLSKVSLQSCVLLPHSDFLRKILPENEDEYHIMLPDFYSDLSEFVVDLLYKGCSRPFSYHGQSEAVMELLQNICVDKIDFTLEPTTNVNVLRSQDLNTLPVECNEDTEDQDNMDFEPLTLLATEKDGLRKTYKCSVEGCLESGFSSHNQLRDHTKSQHGTYPFRCHYCEKRFKHQHSLINHMQNHRSEKFHLCDICGKKFHTKDLCSSHRRTHGDRKLSCNICGATFKQRNVLYQHKSLRHWDRRFVCGICNKQFSKKQNLETHQRIHSGESPFGCEVCQIQFKREHHLKKHLTTLVHIDKVAELKAQNIQIPASLDPIVILGEKDGQAATTLAKYSTCDLCRRPDAGAGSSGRFKSSYHFQKHIRSRGHLQKLLQLNDSGQAIPEHLIPPDYVTYINPGEEAIVESVAAPDLDNENIFIITEEQVE